jgi:Helix-turn-helix domain
MTLNDDEWITVSEAAQISGYNEDHLRELIREKKVIEGQKFSIVWKVSRKSLLAYLEQQAKLGRKRGPKKRSSRNL